MFPFIITWFLFLLSFAFPPALLITGPLFFMVLRNYVLTELHRNRSARVRLEHQNIMAVGRTFGGK